jgi:hypothetical protein
MGYPGNGSDEDPLLRTEVNLFFLLRLLLVISKAPPPAYWRGSFFTCPAGPEVYDHRTEPGLLRRRTGLDLLT